MATYPRRYGVFLLLVCALLLPSATSTAIHDNGIVEADHRRIVDELTSLVNQENYRQNLEIMSLRERQNTNIERVKTLEDRFWVILLGVLGAFVTSAIGAVFSFRASKGVSRDDQTWDGQERRHTPRRRNKLESD